MNNLLKAKNVNLIINLNNKNLIVCVNHALLLGIYLR